MLDDYDSILRQGADLGYDADKVHGLVEHLRRKGAL